MAIERTQHPPHPGQKTSAKALRQAARQRSWTTTACRDQWPGSICRRPPRLPRARPVSLQPSSRCPSPCRARIAAVRSAGRRVDRGQASGSTPALSATSIAQAAAFTRTVDEAPGRLGGVVTLEELDSTISLRISSDTSRAHPVLERKTWSAPAYCPEMKFRTIVSRLAWARQLKIGPAALADSSSTKYAVAVGLGNSLNLRRPLPKRGF